MAVTAATSTCVKMMVDINKITNMAVANREKELWLYFVNNRYITINIKIPPKAFGMDQYVQQIWMSPIIVRRAASNPTL